MDRMFERRLELQEEQKAFGPEQIRGNNQEPHNEEEVKVTSS